MVHTGTAEGGHYYSFIRDRSSLNDDQWFLFNDAEVKPFDPGQIAAECFGGEMTVSMIYTLHILPCGIPTPLFSPLYPPPSFPFSPHLFLILFILPLLPLLFYVLFLL